VDIRNVGPLVGTNGCVAGLVLRVYSARTGNTFLDFCQDYRTCPFSSVIFASDRDKFGNLESLQGKRVEIRGDIITYQDRPEIIIRDPQQIRSAP
jgi:DNA/RNA endonuclease YhcR with UshA esterase domain